MEPGDQKTKTNADINRIPATCWVKKLVLKFLSVNNIVIPPAKTVKIKVIKLLLSKLPNK